MPIINDKPIPDEGKWMTKFKVENDMRTLKITVKNGGHLSGWMIIPFASVKEGEWKVNKQKEKLIPNIY